MKIEHKPIYVSFSHIDGLKGDLFTYFYEIQNGTLTLQSIDLFEKKGRTGKTYTRKIYFHHVYNAEIYNYETNEHEPPKVPEEIAKMARCFFRGYMLSMIEEITE